MEVIKVADATPLQIDWLVAQCEGLNPNTDPERRRQFVGYPGFAEANGFGYGIKQYSRDWSHGGPIITREKISIRQWVDVPVVNAYMPNADWSFDAASPLIAAMRCYIASKLGEEVLVPEELE